ncbi:MAG: Glyoxylase, beta-lactamase superfamily, partial [Mycobacterium sp.]|nr:Glyoxylase, beta-lactamase superfamily [Mycobacterium sp.]
MSAATAWTSTSPPKQLDVNVFTAPAKAVVGERPRPFGEPLGWDPITSTLIYGEYDAVLV